MPLVAKGMPPLHIAIRFLLAAAICSPALPAAETVLKRLDFETGEPNWQVWPAGGSATLRTNDLQSPLGAKSDPPGRFRLGYAVGEEGYDLSALECQERMVGHDRFLLHSQGDARAV